MSGSPRVLVVEDDADIAGVLRRSLDKEGYDVRVAGDGEAALEQSGVFEPDAVVLDLGLPKLDGMEVARRMRDEGDVPILMLTARDALDARVEGLDSGADDYLVKPFEREELLARLRALLRRRPPRGSAFMVVGDLRLNPDSREVFRGERQLELTAREFELLEHLMRTRASSSRARRSSTRSGATTRSPRPHRRRLHLEPAPEARIGRRGAHPPHHPRRRIRTEGTVRTRLLIRLALAVLLRRDHVPDPRLLAVGIGIVAGQRTPEIRRRPARARRRPAGPYPARADRPLPRPPGPGWSLLRRRRRQRRMRVLNSGGRRLRLTGRGRPRSARRRGRQGGRPPTRGLPRPRHFEPRAHLHPRSGQFVAPSATSSTRSQGPSTPPQPHAAVPRPGVLGGTLLALLAGLLVARRAMRPIAASRAPRARWRAHATQIRAAEPQATTRSRTSRTPRGHAPRAERRAWRDRGHARAPARVRGRRVARAAHPAHEHPRQPRAAGGRARRRQPEAGSALRSGRAACAASSPTCCFSRARTPARVHPSRLTSRGHAPRRRARPRASWTTDLARPRRGGVVDGVGDDLHRLAANLIENALYHTPAGTHVTVSVRRESGDARSRSRSPTAEPACR